MGRPLKIAKSQAVITITAASSSTDLVTTSNNFDSLGVMKGMPFVTASNIAGLTAGTTYWILETPNSGANSTFAASATPLDANTSSTPVELSTTSSVSVFSTVGPVDTGYNNPQGASSTYGVVGGNTNQVAKTILCLVKIGANAEANGYVIRQKGATKFLVSDGTNTGVCVLANTANGSLAADTMTVTATKADSSTVRLAYMSDNWGRDFSDNQYLLTFNAAASAPAGTTAEIVSVASL
jgi:hypothetical protein